MSKRFTRSRRKPKGKMSFARAVKKIISKEKETKFTTVTNTSGLSIDASGVDTEITLIQTGDSHNNREGEKIKLQSYYYKGVITQGDATNIVRMVLYSPYQADDVMTSASVGIADSIDPHRFFVHSDQYILPSNSEPLKQVVIKHKFSGNGRNALFNGTTATDCIKGQLFLYYVSDSVVTVHPFLIGQGKLWYKDM